MSFLPIYAQKPLHAQTPYTATNNTWGKNRMHIDVLTLTTEYTSHSHTTDSTMKARSWSEKNSNKKNRMPTWSYDNPQQQKSDDGVGSPLKANFLVSVLTSLLRAKSSNNNEA